MFTARYELNHKCSKGRVPSLGSLVADLSPRRLWFYFRAVHVRIAVEKFGQRPVFFSKYFVFPSRVSSHRRSILLFMYIFLLPKGQRLRPGNFPKTAIFRMSGRNE